MSSNNLLSVKQVAFILKVHPLTIRRYINEKRLKAIKVGGNIRIAENELQDFHKDIDPEKKSSNKLKTANLLVRKFTSDDPLFRIQGRVASIRN